jgi:hypothetical protein
MKGASERAKVRALTDGAVSNFLFFEKPQGRAETPVITACSPRLNSAVDVLADTKPVADTFAAAIDFPRTFVHFLQDAPESTQLSGAHRSNGPTLPGKMQSSAPMEG